MSGGFAKALAVGANQDGRLEVFYIGTNDALYDNWQRAPNDGWNGAEVIGDVNPGTPLPAQDLAVVFSGRLEGILDVFYIGFDDSLHHTEW